MAPVRQPFHIEDGRALRLLKRTLDRLPPVTGGQVEVTLRPRLTAHRGKLLSGVDRGRQVHAGSDMRKRWMVLDTALIAAPTELQRIFVHELYHFVWARAGNRFRWSYEELLTAQRQARGELGWSAELTKNELTEADWRQRTRRWREYVCESFCDTAAWYYSLRPAHPEWTLAGRWREGRRRWWETHVGRKLSI